MDEYISGYYFRDATPEEIAQIKDSRNRLTDEQFWDMVKAWRENLQPNEKS
jgi:hypothetical protein